MQAQPARLPKQRTENVGLQQTLREYDFITPLYHDLGLFAVRLMINISYIGPKVTWAQFVYLYLYLLRETL